MMMISAEAPPAAESRNARGSAGATGGAASGVQIHEAPANVSPTALLRALPIQLLPAQSAAVESPVRKLERSLASPAFVLTSTRQS